MKPKLIRTATVPISLDKLLEGQLHFLSSYFEIVGVSSPPLDLLQKIERREGVVVKAVRMQRGISPLKDLIALWKLIRLFRKEKPQIVHSITPKAGLLSMLAARIAGVPFRLHTFTGLIFPTQAGAMQKLLIQMDRLLCRAATHVYPEGEGVKQDLIDYKITTKPLKVLANGSVCGINTQHFSPQQVTSIKKQALRKKYGIAQEDFVFVFVGRLVGDKGINELVDAFKNLCPLERSREIKLLLVGPFETELDPLQQSTLHEIETNPAIISVGYQEDVRSFFAISDALAFPSYREGFPNVVLQAGAMDLPSIVTDINGSNEIIKNQENGLIIPPKNTEALQNAMLQIMNDRTLYTHLQKNARPMICKRYEQKLVWEALLEEYEGLVEISNV
ncbi:glycosyltransferase family 4 protein [uncultured Mesonia sp.]|uniref:glycosyltransferase family 4 protein n=1 Tax=uncultured Mesonia sp. TaxID=399731 RepID=UPI00374E4D9F